ncbi:MAG: hypothetical protein K9N23_16985 [Akkermansiaceae bacterium]|nr:hypothetical protein [Akkermansiaceae bacterium]
MKIPLALAVLILAVAAGLGWHGSHQLAALRQTRAQLIATAANRGIAPDLSKPAAPGRGPKPTSAVRCGNRLISTS